LLVAILAAASQTGIGTQSSSNLLTRDEVMTMKPTIWGAAALLLLTVASAGAAEEEATDAIDCSAFRKEDYGYFVTKTTRIATPPLDVTLPKGMPIRRGQKAAAVQGKDLAEVIDQNCPS
jgi:hypothetical protein